ncbi:MAG: hypothetical protein J1E63_09135 [Muribaculaceae bacterium]|nr:hypothetical protein [Muribaculaceae bacterium]
MIELTQYNVIEIAWRGRLLFNKEAEYEEFLGIKFDAIKEAQEKGNTEKIDLYYMALDRECHQQCGESLRLLVYNYLKASETTDENSFSWGDVCRDLRVRKRFYRWLFLKSCITNMRLDAETEDNLKVYENESAYKELLKRFYPEGTESYYDIDPIFGILMAFDVVKPRLFHNKQSARARDITQEATVKSLENLLKLIDVLRDDMPIHGIIDKPLSFSQSSALIERILNDRDEEELAECTVARIWKTLDEIQNDCIVCSSPESIDIHSTSISFYKMPGIWIDDSDNGKTRFWVFPDNMFFAFCFVLDGVQWILIPYEFASWENDDSGMNDKCFWATYEANRQLIFSDKHLAAANQVAIVNYERLFDDNGEFTELTFSLDGEKPGWMDWSSFKRLDYDDERFRYFLDIVERIYKRGGTELSMIFENRGAFMTDVFNCLVAIDRKYLYVTDQISSRFYLTYDKNTHAFEYENDKKEETESLLDIEISADRPLYLIPRDKKPKITDQKHIRFSEAVANTLLDHQISVYHGKGKRALCLNEFSISIRLDDEATVESLGIKQVTSREELLSMADSKTNKA